MNLTAERVWNELAEVKKELKVAYAAAAMIDELEEREATLERSLIASTKADEDAANIEDTAQEPSIDDLDEADHPADAAVEEIKALDAEPTGDMTTPPAPNGGMTGWSY